MNVLTLEWPGAAARAERLPVEVRAQRWKAAIWLTLALWVSNVGVTTLGSVLAGSDRAMLLASMRVALMFFGLGLCYIIYRQLRRLSHRSFLWRAIAIAVMSLAAAEVYAWATYFGISLLTPDRVGSGIRWGAAITTVASWTWFFLAWAGLCLALEYSFDVKEEERRSSELRALAQSAKLQALHSQINPHFLFNSLNSLSALVIDGQTKNADCMIGKIADFYRMTLAVDPTEDIPLEREIELQRSYLEIEQLRFPDLRINIDVPAALTAAAVPALLLQPLVENAVKHGIASSLPPAYIGITAREENGQLALEILDSGSGKAGLAKPGAGIGLRNVRARLRERFGDSHSIHAGRERESGFRVRIAMPLELM